MPPMTGNNRRITYRIEVVSMPDNNAQTGDGAWLCASGSQVCIGTRPTLAPNPIRISRKAVWVSNGDMCGAAATRFDHV
jgi:hypothetical protein